jgi:hypothetical protein
MTLELPNSASAQVEESKIISYLLNPNHDDGGPKAKFFLARGFSTQAWKAMRDSLISQGRDNGVTKVTQTPWGTKYQVDCHCPTPDGVNPCIRSVWEIKTDDTSPRLLTAYPVTN